MGSVTFPYMLTQSQCLGLQFCDHRQPSSFLITGAGRVTGRDLEHLTCGRGCSQHGKKAGKGRLAVGDVGALGNFTLSHYGTPTWVTRHTRSMSLRTARPEWELDLGSVLESEVSSSQDVRYLVPSSDLSFPNHREPPPAHLMLWGPDRAASIFLLAEPCLPSLGTSFNPLGMLPSASARSRIPSYSATLLLLVSQDFQQGRPESTVLIN